MLIRGASVLLDDFRFSTADVRITGDLITGIGDLFPEASEEIIQAEGAFLIPGLIDVHMHGYAGVSCSTTSREERKTLGRALAAQGVTGYAAGLATMADEKAFAAIRANAQDAKDQGAESGAQILGIHMEGPFLNPVKKGAMNEKQIQLPSVELFEKYLELADGLIRIMTIAPEMPGAEEVIRLGVSRGVRMSMGHTNALLEEAEKGISWGISRATHTFNAMRALNHRESGVLGASLMNDEIECELIGDFVHVKPEVCLMVYRLKGADRVTLISDACELAGLTNDMIPEGLPYVIKDAAYLSNGTLCGSTCTVARCVRNMISIGVPMEDAVKMASLNPARDLGLDGEYGSIREGKHASMVLVDKDMNIISVFVEGHRFI